ncbi:MAG: hypothetical protein WAN22_08565 [Solirubrobacteraceae bacterium]
MDRNLHQGELPMPIIATAGTMKRDDVDDAPRMPHVIPTRAAAAPAGAS